MKRESALESDVALADAARELYTSLVQRDLSSRHIITVVSQVIELVSNDLGGGAKSKETSP